MQIKLILVFIWGILNTTVGFAAASGSIINKPEAAVNSKPIDCNFTFSPKDKLDEDLLKQWGSYAALQTFRLNYSSINEQLAALKPCYTIEGWQSFNDALEKSGNLNSIRNQKLNSSSNANGEVNLTPMHEGQWKLQLPIEVIYSNNDAKVSQQLLVQILINRRSNSLGISQIIASPQKN